MNRVLTVLLMCIVSLNAAADERIAMEYAPGPIANPLKGLVPYASDTNVHFPHSMEFNYVGLAELMQGYEDFDWQPLEDLLNEIAGRGHQAVFRIYLEYPAKTNVIPKFLLEDGLKVHKYLNTNTQPFPPAKVETPDYEDKNLRRALMNFIAAFGRKYDGDPRIGFITAGLLGTWGEWHTYPKEELFASKTVQAEVMDAYARAFKETAVLLRYPAGEDTWGKASNANRPFGYHDDSFAWATLDTGMFQKKSGEVRQQRAATEVRRMGYEFHVPAISVSSDKDKLKIKLELENRGVAPFYYDWKAEYGLIADGKVIKTITSTGKLTGLLPGDSPRVWNDAFDVSDVPQRKYTLAVRVPNPLPNGLPLRFANAAQDSDVQEWLSLTEITL